MKTEIENRIEELLATSFLSPYLNDEHITDVSYNGKEMFVQHNKNGRYKAEYQPSHDEVLSLGKRIADIQGKEFTDSEPILDTEIAFFRVNFIHHAVSPAGCTFAIRVSKPKLAIQDLTLLANEDVAQLLNVLIQAEMNTIISGRTGSGKTELQKLLVGFIQDSKKITLIEDTMDSHIKALYPEKDVNSWRTLTDSTRENKITYNDLIKAGLRNNPDWMIIAETRGSEAYDMLESALTDHSIITTIHAKRAEAIPSRLISMIGQKYNINEFLLGKDIANTLRIGIYMSIEETNEGLRRFIREIVEFTDFNEEGIQYIPLYQVKSEYNEETKGYENTVHTKPLSNETIEELKYKKLYHLVPDCFINKKEGVEMIEVV